MSTASFQSACLFVIRNEGSEYTNIVEDEGGPTKYGVTLDDLITYTGKPQTANDVKNMTEATAVAVLKSMYWQTAYEALPQSIATAVLDWTFLHGRTAGRMMAQKAANELGAKLTVDGVFGPASIKALNDVRPAYFLNQFKLDIIAYFNELVRVKPSQKLFLAGWTARINRYTSLV